MPDGTKLVLYRISRSASHRLGTRSLSAEILIDDPAVFDKMIGHLSKLCAQDATCSSRISDFAQTMYAVNHNIQ